MNRNILYIIAALLLITSVAFAKSIVSDGNLNNKTPLTTETTIGNLIADAVRFSVGSDIAFIAGSEIKAKEQAFASGNVSAANIQALISFPNDRSLLA